MQDEDVLQISGLQHFAFCRRQWALIYIEDLWQDNFRTVDGALFHDKAHDPTFSELRGDLLTIRGLNVHSVELGVSGQCDVVEFHRDPAGVPLAGREGTWRPYPVEYKRGKPKEHNADTLQLCAQGMCLEEMLGCPIPEGALFYGEPRRRTTVVFSPELRQQVKDSLAEMRALYARRHTPKAKPGKFCAACSLKELCLPQLTRHPSVSDYLRQHLEEDAL